MIDKLINPVSKIVNKFVKDKDLQAKLDHELKTLFHEANLAQIELLKEDAKSTNWFQNSWRPFVGWTCGVAMAYHFVIQPLLLTILTATGIVVELPDFDFAQLSTILMAMLGMSGLRSFEKTKNVHAK
jgi:hypothetical protein|tara:strand:+ start:1637 stop:2020 length:384 start_codon:yes stop_codon:yes gene_type:complete